MHIACVLTRSYQPIVNPSLQWLPWSSMHVACVQPNDHCIWLFMFFVKYCEDSSWYRGTECISSCVLSVLPRMRVVPCYQAFVCCNSCPSSYWRSKASICVCVHTRVLLSVRFLLYMSSQHLLVLMLLRSWLQESWSVFVWGFGLTALTLVVSCCLTYSSVVLHPGVLPVILDLILGFVSVTPFSWFVI
jgi:hypothetical protein